MIYLNVVVLGWILREFEPLQMLIEYIKEKLPRTLWGDYLFSMATCWMCLSFWSGLIYTGDFFISATASLSSMILETLITKWSEKT